MIGVIAEFNPFHNGHVKFLSTVKTMFPNEKIVVVMSGSFTERGDIAIIDKYSRAKIAVEFGVDMVIELPLPYAISSAEYFAKGALKILSKIKGLDKLVFGSESGDIDDLVFTATFLLNETDETKRSIKSYLKQGYNYPKALSLAVSKNYGKDVFDILSKPNDILAIEYIKQILRNNLPITPITVQRKEDFNDVELHTLASAFAIRKALSEGQRENLIGCVPSSVYNLFDNVKSNEDLFSFIGFCLAERGESISDIYGFTEGIENRFVNAYKKSSCYEDFMTNLKTKRFTRTHLQRLAIYFILNITKNDYANYIDAPIYANVLAVGDKSIYGCIDMAIVNGIKDVVKLDDISKRVYALTEKADSIRNLR